MNEYSFLLFGDLHWDRADLHPGKKADGRSDAWGPEGPWTKAFRAFTSELQASLAGENAPRFAMQLGDMINGGTGDEERQCEQLRGAWADFRPCFQMPLIPVIGNHENHSFDGKDGYAIRAWNRVMAPHAIEESGCTDMRNANYSFTVGPDLFVCINTNEAFGYGISYTQELVDWLRGVFAAHPDARYTFLCGHHNFVPSTDWGLHYQRPFLPDEFFQLRRLISERGCIALTADLHQLVCTDYNTDVGSFTELVAFSIPQNLGGKETFREGATTPAEFPVHRIHGEECDPISLAWVRDHYAPGVTRFWYAAVGAGAYVVRVTDNRVEADLHVYGDDPRVPRKTLVVRAPEVNMPSLSLDAIPSDAVCSLPTEMSVENGRLVRGPVQQRRVVTVAARTASAACTRDFLLEPDVSANGVPFKTDKSELAFTSDETNLRVTLKLNDAAFSPSPEDTTLESKWWEGNVFEMFIDWGARRREHTDNGSHQIVLVPLENGDTRVFHFSKKADGTPYNETRTDIAVKWQREGDELSLVADVPWAMLPPSGTTAAPQTFAFDICYHDASLFGGERKRHDCPAAWGTVKM